VRHLSVSSVAHWRSGCGGWLRSRPGPCCSPSSAQAESSLGAIAPAHSHTHTHARMRHFGHDSVLDDCANLQGREWLLSVMLSVTLSVTRCSSLAMLVPSYVCVCISLTYMYANTRSLSLDLSLSLPPSLPHTSTRAPVRAHTHTYITSVFAVLQ
jgi:hypothetical protein